MIGKKPSWWRKYIPGKRALTVVGGLAVAGLGKLAQNYIMDGSNSQQTAPPPRPKPRPTPNQKPKPRGDPCKQIMCSKGIANRKGYLKWSVKGGHPDKGGSTSVFQDVNNCQMRGKFCTR